MATWCSSATVLPDCANKNDIYLVLLQTQLNLVNLLEQALQALARPHARSAKQKAPAPAAQSQAEGLLGSTLLLILAVSSPPNCCMGLECLHDSLALWQSRTCRRELCCHCVRSSRDQCLAGIRHKATMRGSVAAGTQTQLLQHCLVACRCPSIVQLRSCWLTRG